MHIFIRCGIIREILINRARKKVFVTIFWKVVNFNMLIATELNAIKIVEFRYNYFQKL